MVVGLARENENRPSGKRKRLGTEVKVEELHCSQRNGSCPYTKKQEVEEGRMHIWYRSSRKGKGNLAKGGRKALPSSGGLSQDRLGLVGRNEVVWFGEAGRDGIGMQCLLGRRCDWYFFFCRVYLG